jgi:DNA helicase-2/ATP-dependent DNA helicase PcrA
MLTMPLRLFEKESGALRMFQDAYRFVMADEFQDTCHTQFDLLNQIVERHRNLAVVGDPRQTVFSFRSADPAMLLNFQNVYPEARVYPLDQNFRSTALIVALGNALAAPLNYGADGWTANNHGPKARVYCARDDIDEARFVANEIAKLVTNGTVEHPGQTAVLFRTNAQARILTLAMRAAGLPFRVRTDADLFVQSDVRDVVAYLRLAHCPTDAPALWRIVNVPPRRLRSIEQALRKQPVPVNALADWAQKRGGPPARHAVEDLLTLISDLHDATQNCLPANALETVLSKTALADWLARQENASTRLAHIAELRTVMSNSQAPDLATWLVDLHVGEADSSTEVGAPAVTLSTIHSAKGGEWPVVFVTGLEEGLLPHARSGHPGKTSAGEEEERRLAFVAVSRAQVLLYLVHCQTRSTGERDGPPLVRRPSRFLRSLPPELVEQVSGATR